jgi:hypothetical protein
MKLSQWPLTRMQRKFSIDYAPAEALSGKSHPHWFELLGYQRFQSAELAA